MSRQPRIRHWRDSDPKACLKGAKRVARLRPICTGSASKGREHLLLSYTPDSSAFLRMLVALPAHTVAMNRSDSGSGSGGAVIALLATHPRHAPALGSRLRAAHSGRAMLPLRGLEKKQVGGGPRQGRAQQITWPVAGSIALPLTRPVCGSVPFGRLKSRMCGSGLRGRRGARVRTHQPQERLHSAACGRPGRREAGVRTCGCSSGPSRGSAARQAHATRSPREVCLWAPAWPRAWAGSRACMVAVSRRVAGQRARAQMHVSAWLRIVGGARGARAGALEP